jgi:hypothetical protein
VSGLCCADRLDGVVGERGMDFRQQCDKGQHVDAELFPLGESRADSCGIGTSGLTAVMAGRLVDHSSSSPSR